MPDFGNGWWSCVGTQLISLCRAEGAARNPQMADRVAAGVTTGVRGILHAEETPGVEIINALSDAVEEELWREQILGIVMVITINVERRGYLALLAKK